MKIAVYTICWNEEVILPYFIRHYKQYTDDITIYDNESSDRTVEIAESQGCQVKKLISNNKIREDLLTDIKNRCWKEKRKDKYDWVFIVDTDEFIYHRNLIDILEKSKKLNISMLKPYGFQMISQHIPKDDKQIWEISRIGCCSLKDISKSCILSPTRILETNYSAGSHSCSPVGFVRHCSNSGILMLHYSHLSLNYVLDRYEKKKQRLSDLNLENNWGYHYLKSKEQIENDFWMLLKDSSDLSYIL